MSPGERKIWLRLKGIKCGAFIPTVWKTAASDNDGLRYRLEQTP